MDWGGEVGEVVFWSTLTVVVSGFAAALAAAVTRASLGPGRRVVRLGAPMPPHESDEPLKVPFCALAVVGIIRRSFRLALRRFLVFPPRRRGRAATAS